MTSIPEEKHVCSNPHHPGTGCEQPGRSGPGAGHSLIQAAGYSVTCKQLLCERVGITGGMEAITHVAIVYVEFYVDSVTAHAGNLRFIQQPEQRPGAAFRDATWRTVNLNRHQGDTAFHRIPQGVGPYQRYALARAMGELHQLAVDVHYRPAFVVGQVQRF